MANELQPLSLLFQNRLFRIPDYQRGYAWQQSQLIDFWDDIINLQDDRYHYTGLLSLKELKKKVISSWGEDIWMVDAGFKACHIVDGQQRLTTFIVLLNELIEIAKAENKDLTENDIVLGFETLKDISSLSENVESRKRSDRTSFAYQHLFRQKILTTIPIILLFFPKQRNQCHHIL